MQVTFVNERGAYKHLNGQTFDVAESVFGIPDIREIFIAIKVGQMTVDTPLKNAIISEVEKEAKEAYRQHKNGDSRFLIGLKSWAKVHGFELMSIPETE